MPDVAGIDKLYKFVNGDGSSDVLVYVLLLSYMGMDQTLEPGRSSTICHERPTPGSRSIKVSWVKNQRQQNVAVDFRTFRMLSHMEHLSQFWHREQPKLYPRPKPLAKQKWKERMQPHSVPRVHCPRAFCADGRGGHMSASVYLFGEGSGYTSFSKKGGHLQPAA